MNVQELQDDELTAQARVWRQRALRGDKSAHGIAHELEREVRRRFGTPQNTAPQPFTEVRLLDVLAPAPQRRWRLW